MEVFAKIIELKKHQVLFTIDYNSDEEVDELTARSIVDGVTFKTSFAYSSEEEARKAFDKADKKASKLIIESFKEIIK